MAAATLTFPSATLLKNVVDPVDLQDAATKNYVNQALGAGGASIGAAGSNTQIQFNNAGTLGASANLTFDGNLLTITGNISSLNANLGNLTISNYFRGVFDAQSSSQPNITSLGTLTGLNVAGNVDVGNLNVTGSISGNVSGSFTGTVSAPGANTQIVFNDDGTSNATSGLTFDKSTNLITVAGNANVQGGLVTIGGATIAANVSTGNAAIFPIAISNLTVGALAGNITIGSTGGTVTARGTLVANTIVGSNVISNSSNIAVTTDTVVDQFNPALYRTAKYLIKAGNDDGFQSIEVLLVHDNTDSYITIYGAVSSTEFDIVDLSSNISAGNVKLYATGSNANTVVNILSTYVKD
jgi:hypothetical protein